MSDFRLLISIVRREQGETYLNFLRGCGVLTIFASLCNGTASNSTLDYLGIEKTEKVMLQSVVNAASLKKVLRKLVEDMGIDMPGNGIAMTVPVGSVGGVSSLNYFTHGQEMTTNEVYKMGPVPYSLIMVIVDKGNIDLVMDAARSAGAKGGTVINAKGTGTEPVSKFFGVSIAAEKEIIYIATHKADKDTVMQAIMKKSGINSASDAHAVVLSLPVDNLVGLRSLMQEEE